MIMHNDASTIDQKKEKKENVDNIQLAAKLGIKGRGYDVGLIVVLL